MARLGASQSRDAPRAEFQMTGGVACRAKSAFSLRARYPAGAELSLNGGVGASTMSISYSAEAVYPA